MSGQRFAGRTVSAAGMVSSLMPHSATEAAPAASITSSGVYEHKYPTSLPPASL